jgi:SagB-type dehydrogenase family enzyme
MPQQTRSDATIDQEPILRGRLRSPDADPAELFHENSKLHRQLLARELVGAQLLENRRELVSMTARAARRYADAPRVALSPNDLPAITLQRALIRRRSSVAGRGLPLSLASLSALLGAAGGLTRPGEHPLRAVPSAGALYPLEVYLVALDVLGLGPGLYHFDPFGPALEYLDPTVGLRSVQEMQGDPRIAERCASALVITAVMFRTRFKYGLRGYRFALLEAGHLAQNLLLGATALDLAALPVGGFVDDEVNAALGTDGVEEAPLYLLLLGGDGSAPDSP